MNANTFRIICSKFLGMLFPIGEWHSVQREAATRRGQRPGFEPCRLKPLAFSLIVLGAVLPAPTFALPTGPAVASGSATFQQAGSTLTITNTPKAIINWGSFSIGQNEITKFVQQSSASAVLNRVIGRDPSQILGQLQSNGRVFLINPNGILFGAGSRIDTAGLIASTLNLTDADFLADKLRFTGSGLEGKVENQGTITTPNGGQIYLIAPNVENSGIINAPNGDILLAAGQSVEITDSLNPALRVQITAPEGQVINLGQILAESGRIGLHGGMVANAGTISASSAIAEGGKIYLRATQKIDLTEPSKLGADGTVGGEITAIVQKDEQISGELVARGEISAQGNGTQGSGGFVDTSAGSVNIVDGFLVKTSGGEWLVDPADFTIAATGGNITGATLSSNLNSGGITILSSSGTVGGNGDINVNDAVSWSANTLTLTAARDININAVLTASGTSTLTMNTASAASGEAAVAGGTVKAGFNPDGTFKGRVDFPSRIGAGFLTINGQGYTVIQDASALQAMSGGLGGFYALGSSFSASSISNFAPIGDTTTPFTGKFDGLGHTITDLTINRPTTDYIGLFGATSGATLRNVGLVNASIAGFEYVGSLVGQGLDIVLHNSYASSVSVAGASFIGGLVGNIDWDLGVSVIDRAYATGTVTGGIGDTRTDEVGGLIGSAYSQFGKETTIKNSYAAVSIVGAAASSNTIGGLVGFLGESSSIADSYASGSINTGSGSGNVIGGLVGESYKSTTITRSYASGDITVGGSGGDIGGLVGNTWPDFGAGPSIISQSYANVAITITGDGDQIGGLVGFNSSAISDSYAIGSLNIAGSGSQIGGLIGYNNGQTIARSYSAGGVSVSGTPSFVGGLVGVNDGTATNTYWDIDATGQATSDEGSGVNTAIAYTSTTYAGFDFTNTWWISEGNTRPFLRMEWSNNITNAHQLQLMSLNLSASYALANNIDLAPALNAVSGQYPGMWGSKGFVPIGNYAVSNTGFTGNFDGLGHTISNLTINRPTEWDVGLFGYVKGDVFSNPNVKNIALSDVTITGLNRVGSLVGYNNFGNINNAFSTGSVAGNNTVGGLVGLSSTGSITSISSSYSAASVTGAQSLGGLVGTNTGTITNSYSTGSVTGGASSSFIGGLAGYSESYSIISNSYSTGTVQAGNGSSYIGGLVGYSYNSLGNGASVIQSHSNGSVSSGTDSLYVGGLVGYSYKAVVSESYSTGAVSAGGGSQHVGGLVGYNDFFNISSPNNTLIRNSYSTSSVTSGADSIAIGGLVGTNIAGVSNSYSTGLVTPGSGSTSFGGLVGSKFDGTSTGIAINSFWDTQSSGQSGSAVGIGMTTSQMKDGANFTTATAANGNVNPNWDFTTVWNIDSGANTSYPYLRNNTQTPHPGLTSGATTCSICIWDGGGSNHLWSLAANWTGDLLPTTGSIVTVGSYAYPVEFDVSGLSLVSITAASPFTILGSKNLTLTDSSTFSGLLTINSGGILNFSGASKVLNATGGVSNAGTFNLGGTSQVRLNPGGPAFNNSGILNITSTNGWSFVSTGQTGILNNSGTINVNTNYTSWEAEFNNLSSGHLNIDNGDGLSMQNGHSIQGNISLGTGSTLWVSERHGVNAAFDGTIISGNGTIQVISGIGPVADFTNVSAPSATLYVGSGGTANILSGTTAFANLTLPGGTVNNQGTLTMTGTGSIGASATFNNQGTFINNGTLTASAITLGSGAAYKGSGTLNGNLVNNAGTVAPGNSPGTMTINGNYTQGSSGTLLMELAGISQGVNHDWINISGTATLGGTLQLALISGFTPAVGNIFNLITAANGISGNFTTLALPGGYAFSPGYGANLFSLEVLSTVAPPTTSTPVTSALAPALAPVVNSIYMGAVSYETPLLYVSGQSSTTASSTGALTQTAEMVLPALIPELEPTIQDSAPQAGRFASLMPVFNQLILDTSRQDFIHESRLVCR